MLRFPAGSCVNITYATYCAIILMSRKEPGSIAWVRIGFFQGNFEKEIIPCISLYNIIYNESTLREGHFVDVKCFLMLLS